MEKWRVSVIASQKVEPHCYLSQHFCNELYFSHFRFLTVIQQLLTDAHALWFMSRQWGHVAVMWSWQMLRGNTKWEKGEGGNISPVIGSFKPPTHGRAHTYTRMQARWQSLLYAESSLCKWPIKYEWYRAIFFISEPEDMYELEQQKHSVSLATALILYAVHGGEAPHACLHRVSSSARGAYTFAACACVCMAFFFHLNVSVV